MSSEALRQWKVAQDGDLLSKSVSTDARALLLCLAVLAREGTAYTDGYRPLAQALNISKRSVSNRLAKLESEGLVRLAPAPTGPGMNRTIWLHIPAALERNGGSALPPIAQERLKSAAETVEARVPNGGSTRPERWKSASDYQEQDIQEDKAPRAALEAIRAALPADLQPRLTSKPLLMQQLQRALDKGWTVGAIGTELAKRPWAKASPDRLSWEVLDHVEALASSMPPAAPRPPHHCLNEECVNGWVTVEGNDGKPLAHRCPEWSSP